MAGYDATGFLPRILEKLALRYGGNAVGVGLVLLSSLTLATMMASAKELSATYSVWQIVLVRSIGVGAILVPVIVRSRGDILKSTRTSLQLMRVLLGFTGAICMFYSIAHLPLAEASAITYSRVIFVIALAAVIFGDRVGIIGWGAAVIGLSGVTIMLDPAAESLNEAALVAVGGAMIKKLTSTDATATIMCYSAIGFTTLSLIPAILTWQPISWHSAPVFVLVMIGSITSNWCFINSYRHGEASIIGTVEYSRLVAAAFVGFLIFDEIPSLDATIGICLIMAASFIAIRRDRIRNWLTR
jgi:drug/metabolite transporter (DMT)-like permease